MYDIENFVTFVRGRNTKGTTLLCSVYSIMWSNFCRLSMVHLIVIRTVDTMTLVVLWGCVTCQLDFRGRGSTVVACGPIEFA